MQTSNHSIRLAAAAALAMVLGSYVFATSAQASDLRQINRINSGVRVEATETVGDVSSINGRIRLDRGAEAGAVESVNGSIQLQDGVSIAGASSVNGDIRLGADVQVMDSVETVNGSVRAGPGSHITAGVRTVNGRIELRQTEVGADIQSSNGDIELREGSVVHGDVIVRGRHSWLSRIFSFGQHQTPDLIIDAESTIHGAIHLYQEVDLHIHDDARIGEVIYHY